MDTHTNDATKRTVQNAAQQEATLKSVDKPDPRQIFHDGVGLCVERFMKRLGVAVSQNGDLRDERLKLATLTRDKPNADLHRVVCTQVCGEQSKGVVALRIGQMPPRTSVNIS